MTNYPIHTFGGRGPVLNLALANGFPPETYIPLMQPLTDRYRVVSLLPRALWPDPPSPESLESWHDMADDLLAGMDEHGFDEPIIGVGHSMGGIATMLAAIRQPERFRALILLDPTILPQHLLIAIRLMRLIGLGDQFPVAKRAAQRRNTFTDQQEAFDYWRPKSLFKQWDDEMLWRYTRAMVDGGGEGLVWSREWETRYFETVLVSAWRDVRGLRGLLPTLVVSGQTSEVIPPRSAERLKRILPGATHVTIEGAGHLFPQEEPHKTRVVMQRWLDGA